MISYKSAEEIELMRRACRIVAGALHEVRGMVAPGVATQEIDFMIRDFVKKRGGQLLFYKYRGFPANSCISINHEVVHGIPKRRRVLKDGDIVSVDVGVKIHGYCGDSAWTFPVGAVSDKVQKLLDVGRESLHRGIEVCRVGGKVSDIGREIQSFVESEGFSVVKKYVGHGIGTELHEDPQVPNYVEKGILRENPNLKRGMVLAIEPMVNVGTDDTRTLDDGWTVVTADGEWSVHFEHSVAITEDGPDVLTLCEDGSEA